MKKRVVMKKWVEYLLLGLFIIALILGASDCESLLTFITTHIISLIMLVFIALMFVFYGRDGD